MQKNQYSDVFSVHNLSLTWQSWDTRGDVREKFREDEFLV